MMQEAPAVMANSRNLLSFGSRQALIVVFGKNNSDLFSSGLALQVVRRHLKSICQIFCEKSLQQILVKQVQIQ
jgi:hypothetical protein